jgi:hypothetical protein
MREKVTYISLLIKMKDRDSGKIPNGEPCISGMVTIFDVFLSQLTLVKYLQLKHSL